MLQEIKEYWKNGNLKHTTFVDEQNMIQGMCKRYFYDQKILIRNVFKNHLVHNVCEFFYNPDKNFLFYRRNCIRIYNSNAINGIDISFYF